ncbi:MAG: glycosyl transferase [Saprospiraceae bacterium]|nr:glycosyl transferase [Candidatus Vicinibacter affinis]MBP6173573.1 hypothetical protein [Saprospiraceae bacterium]MBK6573913.1 glycosyl transferase [Candidatus Vicinibacter affinis]MBK7302853.1 glycosyl transferase [Candidatus Vicinibacter affinis]MBK7695183.1 glycosyl transferase [Candidatus Vicinibacter affinis]
MKILYSIQGTGNGHLSRAKSILPYLEKYGQVDYLISGRNYCLDFPVKMKYHCHGVSFKYDNKGGIDYLKTFKSLSVKQFFKEVNEIPVHQYDFVINDFEPVTVRACKQKKVPCISFSHHASFLSSKVPMPPGRKDYLAWSIMKNYARTKNNIGLHFEPYDDFIFTPVIKDELRNVTAQNEGHITVYLSSFSLDNLYKIFSKFPQYKFEVFHCDVEVAWRKHNIEFKPANSKMFNQSLLHSNGLIAHAGFETPAEAFYLGKPMFLFPIKNQFEQACNAAAAEKLGAVVAYKIDDRLESKIRCWLEDKKGVQIDFPHHTDFLIQQVISRAENIKN